MFEYFFCKSESFEHPISDREFEWLLVVESPPACPHQSLAYDDEPVARSSSTPLNAMQMMFDKTSSIRIFSGSSFIKKSAANLADFVCVMTE